MQPCKTGDQLYSDASPNSEYSLVYVTPPAQKQHMHGKNP